jgi:putative flippase GtrA
MTSEKKPKKRPLIYFVVGVGNTLVDYLFYLLLRFTILPDTDDIALAGIISGGFAMICAFTAHSLVTWRGAHISHRTALKFFGFTAFGLWIMRPLLLSVFIRFTWLYDLVYSICQSLHLPFSEQFIADTGAFGFMAVLLIFYNYYVYEHYVFKKKKPAQTP